MADPADNVRIFSGDYSRDMWADINKCESVEELKYALYFVCCRLQQFEARFERRTEQHCEQQK